MAKRFDFEHLTPAERIELAEELWESVTPSDITLSRAQAEELDRRREDLRTYGSQGLPWGEFIDRDTLLPEYDFSKATREVTAARMAQRTAAHPLAKALSVSDGAITVELVDGRVIAAPLVWYPRLLHGTPEQRSRFRLIGGGEGIHWPDLDEDISVEALLAGRASAESDTSFNAWLASRPS